MRKNRRKVAVYRFLEFDRSTGRYRISAIYGTRAAIRYAKGLILERTEALALASSLDHEGFASLLISSNRALDPATQSKREQVFLDIEA